MFFQILEAVNNFYWERIGFLIIIVLGLYFTFQTRFFQFRVLKAFPKEIKAFANFSRESRGIHPLKLYFASIGGMIGIGNIVGVAIGLVIGGPGVLFWLWIASFSGMLIKYAEIYLSTKYRTPNQNKSYDGGPMHYLEQAFGSKTLCMSVAGLLCFYGVEVLQFSVVCDALVSTYHWHKPLVVIGLIVTTFYTAIGGVKRTATICSILMPIFMVLYIAICLYIIAINVTMLPSILWDVLRSAFTGHAAVGGFVGSGFLLAAHQGVSRAVYSGDIGIGFDSMIQSETHVKDPKQQARLSMFGLFTDTFICTLTLLIILISGLWTQGVPATQLTTRAIAQYFPCAPYFVSTVIFLAGFTTIIAYLTVAFKASSYLHLQNGKYWLALYAVPAFIAFAYVDNYIPDLLMQTTAGLLMLCNVMGMIKLRSQIEFK